MSTGRHSRFPAVNRGVDRAAPQAEEVAPQVEEAAPEVEEATTAPQEETAVDPADLTVDEVLEWVGDDEDRRASALAAEEAGKARKTLVAALSDEED